MAKRAANTELNHDNWDKEEKPEDPGVFTPACPEVIEKRVIRTAKRRIPVNQTEEKKAFTNFTGFGPGTSNVIQDPKQTFSFLSNTNGISKEPTKTLSLESKPSDSSGNSDDKKSSYYVKLKELNGCVLEWITMHVKKDPYCILTPIFKDYEKHFESLSKEKSDETPKKENEFSASSSQKETKDTTNIPSSTTSKIGDKTNTPSFSLFGPTSTVDTSTKSTPFKLTPFGNAPPSGFSFSSDKPFSFGNVASQATSSMTKEKEQDNESEEQSKNEVKLVKEDDAVFSQRVKMFVKKDKEFTDRGIGTLYVKPATGGKHQAIVRADTNLGNILLNIILNDAVPTKRVGKNNVVMVCIPTPDSKPPPTSVLLKVKTEEEANNLLAKLDEFKKKDE